MSCAITPPRRRAGQLVTFTVTLDSTAYATCCTAQILFGDNQGAGQEEARYCREADADPPAGHAVWRFHHAYRRGGTYTPWISALTACDGGQFLFQFKPTFRVENGPLLSNGPWVPWVTVDDSVPVDAEDTTAGQWFQGGVVDHDGTPWSWTWVWGDGTTTVVSRNPDGCHWPDDGGWTEASAGPRAAHTFPHAGTYTVKLVAVTAGCDGRDRQQVTASMQWTVEN
jgi:hypothetical protein